MNLSETARLLATIAAFNNRTVGEHDVMAWQSVLSDVALADAEEAVRRHFAESTDWMMPAHVRHLVRDIARERVVAATATGWAPGQAGVPKDQALPEVTTGGRLALGDLPAAVADLLARVRTELPEGNREKLFPRETAWAREHAAFVRTHNATPNPLYRPNPHVTAPLADDSGLRAEHVCLIKDGRCLVPGHEDPVTVRCLLCPALSQDLAEHMADYHPSAACVGQDGCRPEAPCAGQLPHWWSA